MKHKKAENRVSNLKPKDLAKMMDNINETPVRRSVSLRRIKRGILPHC